MAERIPQSVAIRVPLQAYLSSDHVSPATGKTIAVTISKNGGAYANPSAGATNAVEIGSGSYYVDLSTTDTGTAGPLFVLGSASGVDNVVALYDAVNAHNAGFDGVPAVAAGAAGGLPTADASNQAKANVTAWAGDAAGIAVDGNHLPKVDLVDIAGAAVSTSSAQLGVNVVNIAGQAAALDANNFLKVDVEDIRGTASAGAAGYVGPDWGHVNASTTAVNLSGTTISTSQAVGSVGSTVNASVVQWNGTAVSGSVPPDTVFIRAGTAQGGGASTITLDAGASATNNLYQNQVVVITGGTGAGQSAIVASYVGATKVATINGTWAVNPDNTSHFLVYAFGAISASVSGNVTVGGYAGGQDPATSVWGANRSSFAAAGTFGQGVAGVQGNVTGSVNSVATSPANWAALGITAAGKISEVVLCDTLTTYTNDTPQSGDAFARLGLPAGATIAADIASCSHPATAQTLDLTTAVPGNPTRGTVGDALLAAESQGFGKWVIAGTTLTLYRHDGVTVARTFTLDSSSVPTQRA